MREYFTIMRERVAASILSPMATGMRGNSRIIKYMEQEK
jgi:hypothetical protein